MATSTFTREQVRDLTANPFVTRATNKRIEYSDEFKRLFIERYRLGIQPKDIFRDAGFDVEALGNKRIERASDRWRQMNHEGRLGEEIDYVAVHNSRRRQRSNLVRTIEQQNALIISLEKENQMLRRKLDDALKTQ